MFKCVRFRHSSRTLPTLVVFEQVRLLHHPEPVTHLQVVYQPGTRHLTISRPVTCPMAITWPYLDPSPFWEPSTGPGPVAQAYPDPSLVRGPFAVPGPVTYPYPNLSPVWGPSHRPGPITQLVLDLSPVYRPSQHPRPAIQPFTVRYLYGGRSGKQYPSADCFWSHPWTCHLSGGCYGDYEFSPGPSQTRHVSRIRSPAWDSSPDGGHYHSRTCRPLEP